MTHICISSRRPGSHDSNCVGPVTLEYLARKQRHSHGRPHDPTGPSRQSAHKWRLQGSSTKACRLVGNASNRPGEEVRQNKASNRAKYTWLLLQDTSNAFPRLKTANQMQLTIFSCSCIIPSYSYQTTISSDLSIANGF